MLEAADGSRYVMQAYAQIVDKTLDYAALPDAWRQAEASLRLALFVDGAGPGPRARAAGKATVVQDELENTYQKLD